VKEKGNVKEEGKVKEQGKSVPFVSPLDGSPRRKGRERNYW